MIDWLGNKIILGTEYLLSKMIKPDFIIGDIKELNYKLLKENNIKGLILDVDETLRFEGENIPLENIEWLKKIKEDIKISVVSNGLDYHVEYIFKKLDIPYYGLSFKPCKKNIVKAIFDIGIDKTQILSVGDNYFSDMLGGLRAGTKLCLVKKRSIKTSNN